jgi:hypothetical protein
MMGFFSKLRAARRDDTRTGVEFMDGVEAVTVNTPGQFQDELAERMADDQPTAEELARAAMLDDAAEAASAAANADHAAAYGWMYAGHEQALAEQAAAREVLPDLTPAVSEKVTAWEDRHDRAITLAEVRWLQRLTSEDSAAQAKTDEATQLSDDTGDALESSPPPVEASIDTDEL